jgi:hypothetical protein
MISQDPVYLSAKASTYYWRRQLASGRTDEVAKERMEHWTTLIAEIRKRKGKRGGRAPGQLNKSNPNYTAPLKIPRPAKMPKVPKEVVLQERVDWVPPPLSWE